MIKLVIFVSTVSVALGDFNHEIEKRQTQTYYNPTQPTYAQQQPYYRPIRPTNTPSQQQVQSPYRPTQPTYTPSQPQYNPVQPVYPQRPLYAILSFENEAFPDGSYRYAYETENGISVQESGQLKGTGDTAGTAAQGSYSYTSPEGIPVQVQYTADENGFQPIVKIILTNPKRIS